MQPNNLKRQDDMYTQQDDTPFDAVFAIEEGLRKLGLTGLARVHANLTTDQLYDEALQRKEVSLTADRAMVALTGQHTGRSPNDKYVVRDEKNTNEIAWGKVNQPYEPAAFEGIKHRITEYLKGREIFVQDLYAGAQPEYRLPVRIITTTAWHNLFARNMFIRPTLEQLAQEHTPAFTLIHVPEFMADPAVDKTCSEAFVMVDFTQGLALIGGTSYAGEIKKTIFTVMNYILPAKGVLPMHASANHGPQGDVTVFFGLSGTGKTTLSAESSRTLIGDDEHGWSDNAVFNFEGGCYAKVINLSPQQEPEIYAASTRYGTVLENVVVDPTTRKVNFNDGSLTENTRACYPIDFIPNASPTGLGGLPKNIVMLTCDAYGVLPPISKLTADQAMYHFLSGYTARVAGTEKGVTEPQATFSACFGAPFMPRAPEVYAQLLGEKISRHKVDCWLVNTGWSGGGYGVGKRMPINVTRTLLRAALSGEMAKGQFVADGMFGLKIPQNCEGVPADILTPRAMWQDKNAYDTAARKVIALFAKNFEKFGGKTDSGITLAAIG